MVQNSNLALSLPQHLQEKLTSIQRLMKDTNEFTEANELETKYSQFRDITFK